MIKEKYYKKRYSEKKIPIFFNNFIEGNLQKTSWLKYKNTLFRRFCQQVVNIPRLASHLLIWDQFATEISRA